ncbi:50S ribosomal protein L25/general stress protein Ctc [Nisaea acidiphila]|uniref:Large ribosomal subunit protein bL25 n=1 Tax=Nisaea acidiphila TaxID=1862145 RepID=A0A9J7AYC1_9PROT|nr:50S ribosomal protein L25/general stress protein Ctc [Nisaea acidiphila]UUX51268.1 50S ribosomal protein L25/general stress protein Ctc [Nisaea acidiphila]
MSDVIELSAQTRDRVGKGSARAARRAGLIPAVIYGDKKDPVSVTLEERTLTKQLHQSGFFSTLIDLEVDGKKHRVLARDVQLHPVTDRPEHVDFLRVSASSTITVAVPVEFINEDKCPGLKAGGVLNVVRHEVEVSCRPDQMPSALTLNLEGWNVGDSIHISAFDLPEGVTPTITDRDFTVVTIAAPSAMKGASEDTDEEAGEEAEAEAAEEGESED